MFKLRYSVKKFQKFFGNSKLNELTHAVESGRESRAALFVLRPLRAAVVAAIGMALASTPANAQYATGGSGAYRNQIIWFDWGAPDAPIPAGGASITNTANVAGQTLSVTCSLSSITGTFPSPKLRTYRPGSYFEDGLDQLYNIGGTEESNTMDIGLITPGDGQTAQFTFSCSATLNGLPFALNGLVFADAETTSIGEFTRAELPAGATMRVIERFREPGCTAGYNIDRSGAFYEYSVTAPFDCAPDDTAPLAVNFIDGASTARILLQGGGKQAVALGVMVNVADYGDAPSGYGTAAHLPQTTWAGGEVPNGSTNIFSPGFALASLVQPTNALLGSRVDIENAPYASATATLDDTNGVADEDGVNIAAVAPLYRGMAGRAYSVPIACVGNAPIAGWIDFDRNGTFDSDERTSTSCSGGSATLSWTVPSDVQAGQSYLRIRTALVASEIANPIGVAGSGEVEDYALAISDPRIRVAKITIGSAGGAFDFSATNTVDQPESLTTAVAGVAITGAPVSIVDINAPVQVAETSLPAGWGMTGLTCTNAAARPVVGVVYDGAARTATIPTGRLTSTSDITCTFTNANLPTLALAKTWVDAAANDTATLSATGGALSPSLASTAETPNETDTGIPVKVEIGDVLMLSEVLGAGNVGSYDGSSWSCSGGTLTGGNTLTIGAADAARAIVCTITNTRQQTDLAVVKTVTPNPVRSGQVVSYTIVATNNGPNTGNGALLQDIVGPGLDCTTPLPVADCVGSGGAACPSPTVPTSALLGSGITIGTFPVGGQITVTLQCTVTATGRP